ncbi:MAG: AAA family ATPase [Oligoflexia bacterium]|jgi:MoxR-like ATPase
MAVSMKQKGTGKPELIGRELEHLQLIACLRSGRHVLIEGPVGVGKTHLALSICAELGRPVFRVDGDGRYSEQKLSGWFDPPLVIKHGYTAESFVPGPLVEAMRTGGVLFINELNRLPEGVQNVLLPAIDERRMTVPRLGAVVAQPGFSVIATQNPKEFVATSHLSEAILDRFELVVLDYQNQDEERAIVARTVKNDVLIRAAVTLARMTRINPRIKRGASVRAAQAVAEIAAALVEQKTTGGLEQAFVTAALLALPTRIELERDAEASGSHADELRALVSELAKDAFSGAESPSVKKKN